MPTSTAPQESKPTPQLKTTSYDRASSWVISLLIMVGGLVIALLAIWLSRKLYDVPVTVQVRLAPGGGGVPDGVPGDVLHVDGPQRQEIGEETDLIEPKVQEVMAMVVDAVARKVADLDNPIFTESDAGSGGGNPGNSRKRGYGFGGGPGGGGPVWEMQYDERTLAVYAQQLDFFGIELAAVGGDKDRIEYASGFTAGSPTRRSGTRDEEMKRDPLRTYFTHRSGTVQKYDQQLLAKAGINTTRKIILQYYTEAQEQVLLRLQQQFRGLEQEQIAKTVFAVRPRGNGFEFYVVDQVRR
jgi:hypothetical protein